MGRATVVVPSFSSIIMATPSVVPRISPLGNALLSAGEDIGGIVQQANVNRQTKQLVGSFADQLQGTNPDLASMYSAISEQMPVWAPLQDTSGQGINVRGGGASVGGVGFASPGPSMQNTLIGNMLQTLQHQQEFSQQKEMAALHNGYAIAQESAKFQHALKEKEFDNQLPPTEYQKSVIDDRAVERNIAYGNMSFNYAEREDKLKMQAESRAASIEEKKAASDAEIELKKRQDIPNTPEWEEKQAKIEGVRTKAALERAQAIEATAKAAQYAAQNGDSDIVHSRLYPKVVQSRNDPAFLKNEIDNYNKRINILRGLDDDGNAIPELVQKISVTNLQAAELLEGERNEFLAYVNRKADPISQKVNRLSSDNPQKPYDRVGTNKFPQFNGNGLPYQQPSPGQQLGGGLLPGTGE